MTEQLHDMLTRIADQAGSGSIDPTVWARGRRARRRERRLRASAAVLAAVALLGAFAIGLSSRDAPPPADRRTPAPHPTGAGIPSTVRGIHGNGGLDLETDLAVGPASVAIANHSGAFVVTAADGVYHRLQLPGFDPTAFDDDHPGVALSPDGTRLAYGWRATKPAGATGRTSVGTRILDLRTGALRKIPGAPGDFTDTKVRFSTFGYGWSPNGRYLVMETLTKDSADAGPEHWWAGVDTATARFFMFTHETRDNSCPGEPNQCPPMTLVRPGLSARVKSGVEFTGDPKKSLLVTSGAYYFTDLPGNGQWAAGRFTPNGRRIMLQPDGVGSGLVLVTDRDPGPHAWQHEGSTTLLALDRADWPAGAKIDVLGWVGPDHALAMVNRGTGTDSWEPSGELDLVHVNSISDTTTSEAPIDLHVVGHVEPSDAGTTYSFATGFASADAPTQNFGGPSAPKQADVRGLGAPVSQHGHGRGITRLVALSGVGLALLLALVLLLGRRSLGRAFRRDH